MDKSKLVKDIIKLAAPLLVDILSDIIDGKYDK
ncbi:MAG: hypothetical protein Q612_NSC00113G0002 [Negativicoccus succinicivorans DORA_17_25]|uniref:Uncharacterized protein n=2 Tax=Bacillota TaxID=1239 RepID=A0A6N3FRA9_9FIRM|nr:MAG: hypothetical protein Q612_NSC00113G0002 [Negativicoccus succinicivorans DORA_17_25]